MNTVGFIGAGNMGGAILKGMIESCAFSAENIYVCDRSIDKKDDIKCLNINVASLKETVTKSDYIILAVKPAMFKTILPQIAECNYTDEKTFISIAAGITISEIKKHFKNADILRAMPNLCLQAGEGMTVIASDENVSEEKREFADKIFSCSGKSVRVCEKAIDACTAINGSGPAYIFMVIEAMADAAVKCGIDRKTAYLLSSQTVLGSGAMQIKTGLHPAVLKDMVCSPGGTTIEAVKSLENSGLRASIMSAVDACVQKAEKMSGK